VGQALAGPYADLDARLSSTPSYQRKLDLLADAAANLQSDALGQEISGVSGDANSKSDKDAIDHACQTVAMLARVESSKSSGSAKDVAAEIKRSPFYRDNGEKDESNWLGRALDRLRNLSFKLPDQKRPTGAFPEIGQYVIWFVWFALGVGLIVFVVFAVKRVDWKTLGKRKKSAGGGVLEEDEPDRTLDEWLQLADKLESEGRHREAVRGLYLACLLKIDEARIAKFDRGQTNWEHLERIETSPRLPEGLDFRTPTQAFDRIWYGYQVQGAEDVARFRLWYRAITEATQRAAA
jgi:hypothetical protein